MNEKAMFECGICYFQLRAQDFAPITASADFSALKCPKNHNDDADCLEEIRREKMGKAA